MTRQRAMALSAGVLRALVGAMWIWAVITKFDAVRQDGTDVLVGIEVFDAQIVAHGLISKPTSTFIAWSIVTLEAALGAWLLSHKRPNHALVASIVLVCTFSVYMTVVNIRGGDPSCGCFGKVSKTELSSLLLRNAGISAVCLAAITLDVRSRLKRSEPLSVITSVS